MLEGGELALREHGWEEGQQTWEGERRHVKREVVSIDWSLEWHADELKIRLRNSPKDRNYEVLVVIEEQLASGNKLHTIFEVPAHGQLTYAPKEFFVEEANANARAQSILSEFIRRYSESVVPGPTDPIIGIIRPGDFLFGLHGVDILDLPRMQVLADAAERLQPDLLREAIEAVDGRGSCG